MKVEIVYALPNEQVVLAVDVPEGSTVQAAIIASRLLDRYPEIDLTKNKVGIYGKQMTLETVVVAGDRIEIYRPLIIDPKQARKVRAKKI